MGKDIVMIHGANEGGWCDTFKTYSSALVGPAMGNAPPMPP